MSKDIIAEETLMSYKVIKDKKGDYICNVKAHGATVNSWNLGSNEEVAHSKTVTIVETYLKGLEYVQDQIRQVFAHKEDAIAKEQ